MFASLLPSRITALAAVGCAAAFAIAGSATGARSEQQVSVELNKLEGQGQGCRAYVVVNNSTETAYSALKLDLVMFQPDGVIGRRFAIDLAPVRPQKRTVKLFDLAETACDKVGSFLVNDVLDCKVDTGTVEDCLARIKVSSLTNVQLSK